MIEEIQPTDKSGLSPEELAKHGIKRVSVDYFHVGGYRYSDVKDAMAQAQRAKPKP